MFLLVCNAALQASIVLLQARIVTLLPPIAPLLTHNAATVVCIVVS